MDRKQEHAATLAAFGTIGIAAAGLALGAGEETLLLRPGKRKSPGSDGVYISSPSIPPPSRRVVSSPNPAVSAPAAANPRSFSTSLFRRKSPADPERASSRGSNLTESRGSTLNRNGFMPPRPVSILDEENDRPRSSWKRRLSTMSSLNTSSPPPSTYNLDLTSNLSQGQRSVSSTNRLVKRATSQRLMSSDSAKGTLFRRPATSHQRSTSMMAIPSVEPPTLRESYKQHEERPVSSASIWRPFFTTGYPRKRYVASGARDGVPRTVSTPYAQHPTLVNARTVQRQSLDNDQRNFVSSPVVDPPPDQKRVKRSLSSFRRTGRQRYFTEPVIGVSSQNVHGSILSAKRSPLSPVSRSSTFDIDLPPGTPIFTSSPPLAQAPRTNPSINKRISIAPSDPNTASSDNDTRLFSDDESMDFQSDTAYDSLATRATVSSQSGYRQPKIETIFDDSGVQPDGQVQTLEALMQRSTLNERGSRSTPSWNGPIGIGIHGFDDEFDEPMDTDEHQKLTPVREHPFGSVEELNATPMPLRRAIPTVIGSSPPSSVIRRPLGALETPSLEGDLDVDMDDEDSIDWSPKSDRHGIKGPVLPSNSPILRQQARLLDPGECESKRSSIFDWSENQKTPADVSNGIGPRPKTVHGKHANDQSRSRTSGRKGPSAVHLRSQSVPVNRDSGADLDVPPTTGKFNTWGLGKKGVSEEWSDDFEFDDVEETSEPLQLTSGNQNPGPRDSVRSVKVPQAIIDRQASVHQQFSQVQEFMLLVEELKRLRSRGLVLGVVEGSSRSSWTDAENIINLATLNDEDEEPIRPSSPSSSDIFGDELSPNSRRISAEDSKSDSLTLRSASGPATSPNASRPRGESLAQAKSFLQTIHQNRSNPEQFQPQQSIRRDKLPFNTQDLRDLVLRTSAITRDLKELVREAEGVTVSPQRTPQKHKHDPTFSQLFNPPNSSPMPSLGRAGLPKSKSANSYLSEGVGNENSPFKLPMIEV